MSRDLSISILLPMDAYDANKIYTQDDGLTEEYMRIPEDRYFRKLKIKSVYASEKDILEYIYAHPEKYSVKRGEKWNSASYTPYGITTFRFPDGSEAAMYDDEIKKLRKPHVNETLCCRQAGSYSPAIYGADYVLKKLFDDGAPCVIGDASCMYVTDETIKTAMNIILKETGTAETEILESCLDDIGCGGAPEGKLILALILAKEIAKRRGGAAFASYD